MSNSSTHLLLLLLLIVFSTRLIAAQAATCDAKTYGKPVDTDCTTLFQKFTEPQDLHVRFFDEEQLRVESDHSWPGIDNPFVSPIVQVPKYYSMSQPPLMYPAAQLQDDADVDLRCPTESCNFALMHYTNPRSRQAFPLGISNWASIKTAGLQLVASCLKTGSISGGEVFVKDSTSEDPVLVIFMWASGAKFEERLNQYENDPMYSAQLSQTAIGVQVTNETNNTNMRGGPTANMSLNLPMESVLPSSMGEDVGDSFIDTSRKI